MNLGAATEYHGKKRFYATVGVNLIEQTTYKEDTKEYHYYDIYEYSGYQFPRNLVGQYFEDYLHKQRSIYMQVPIMIGWEFGRYKWQRHSFQISVGGTVDLPIYAGIRSELIGTNGKRLVVSENESASYTFERPKIGGAAIIELAYKV